MAVRIEIGLSLTIISKFIAVLLVHEICFRGQQLSYGF